MILSPEYAQQIRQRVNEDKAQPLGYYDPMFEPQTGWWERERCLQGATRECLTRSWNKSLLDHRCRRKCSGSDEYHQHWVRERCSRENDQRNLPVRSSFGAMVYGHNTGIIYNNQMDDFSQPGLSNYYGYAPSPANFIKPCKWRRLLFAPLPDIPLELEKSFIDWSSLLVKRPMSSMSPIVVTDSSGTVIFTAGGSGGSRIISSVAQVAIYNLWLGKSIRDAVDMPRLHQQLIPMELELEKRFPVVRSPSLSPTPSPFRCRMWFTVCWRRVTRSRVSEADVSFRQSSVDMRTSCGRWAMLGKAVPLMVLGTRMWRRVFETGFVERSNAAKSNVCSKKRSKKDNISLRSNRTTDLFSSNCRSRLRLSFFEKKSPPHREELLPGDVVCLFLF